MMNLSIVLAFVAINSGRLCNGAEQSRNKYFTQSRYTVLCDDGIVLGDENGQMPMEGMVQIHIVNHYRVQSCKIGLRATTSTLYEAATSMEILKGDELLIDRTTGNTVDRDSSIQIHQIVNRGPSASNAINEMNLRVVPASAESRKIAVFIRNGQRTQAFLAKPETSTHECYAAAVKSGLVGKYAQIMLCHENGPHRKLCPGQFSGLPNFETLEQHLDPRFPNELKLKIEPYPENELISWVFRDMSPKQELPIWKQHDHNLYGKQSQIVAVMEGWTGKLNLKFVPRTIQLLVIKGLSVTVEFKDLRYGTLKDLCLDFKYIEGIDWLSLEGSQLQILRLPIQVRERYCREDAVEIVELLKEMRAQGKIQLDLIKFGERERIVYDPSSCDYFYCVRPRDCMVM